MAYIDLIELCKAMSAEYFSLARGKVSEYTEEISSLYKDKNVIRTSLDILCAENLDGALTPEQFGQILECLFKEQLHSEKAVLHFVSRVMNVVNTYREFCSGEAATYYDYLQKQLHSFQNLNRVDNKTGKELMLNLEEFLKISLAIYPIKIGGEAYNKIDELDFDISVTDVDEFTEEFYAEPIIKPVTVVKKQVRVPVAIEVWDPFYPSPIEMKRSREKEERRVADLKIADDTIHNNCSEKILDIILTWLLVFRICEKDGYSTEDIFF